ncbi:hypothetical protein [Escherichia coli]|uniref:hypothetical protein n=1 Tax=Escherichia coli TaxID=562 RepID=UPI0010B04025|nr:hypothetical protein [Escherichia coli]GCG54424.1 hypothetical protein BvCms16BK_04767 [Escherichia coli]
MSNNIVLTHKNDVKIGDTIIHNGTLRTMGKESFTNDQFMGRLILGDSYRLGYQMVHVVENINF